MATYSVRKSSQESVSTSVQSRALHWPLLKATGASSMSTGAEMARYESYEVQKYATIQQFSAKKRKNRNETSW